MTLLHALAPPTVLTHGPSHADAPIVVLLHGRGTDEHAIGDLAGVLPAGARYLAVRAPVPTAGGNAWYERTGVGRPDPASLAESMRWFGSWLDTVAPAGRPVVLVGFSGGAVFAGAMVLSDPQRFAGAALLYGSLPFFAGIPVEPERLTGLPVFLAQGENDTLVPRELLDATWSYLTRQSGAATRAHLSPGGHAVSVAALGGLAEWLTDVLAL